MSDAADKLARTRLAIIAHLQQKERHHERRDNQEYEDAYAQQHDGGEGQQAWSGGRARERAAGWLGHIRHVLGTWWRHHPAHMGVELAAPVLSNYAARKPAQYLAIAAALGAVVVVVRPWRLISVTGLIVALLKSSQLSTLVLSAMAGSGDDTDQRPLV